MGLEPPLDIYDQLSVYLELLLRWNAKTNLTAVRDPEQIVTRHFGESLFAASVLFGSHAPAALDGKPQMSESQLPRIATDLADLGSGAGFPGLPIKLAVPALRVTLIESQNKKATFLKEVIRALRLDGIEVYSGRAEQWGKTGEVVTLRAVENFASATSVARNLVAPGGRLCLLVGRSKAEQVMSHIAGFQVHVEQPIPERAESVVLVGTLL